MSIANSDLIRLLEKEMSRDVIDFDVPPADEYAVDFGRVNEWYTSTEKVIRVLGNIFAAPTFQSINQLRYAGHHILKAQLASDVAESQSNLIEAFKHCKRALYDALDFYIYRLNEHYLSVLPYLSSDGAVDLERQLKALLIEINDHREQSKTRIGYYSGVQKSFVKGLDIIEKINSLLRKSGLSESLSSSRRELSADNARLRRQVEIAQEQLDEAKDELAGYAQKAGNMGTWLGVGLAVIVAVATFFGVTYNSGKPTQQVVSFETPVAVSVQQEKTDEKICPSSVQ